MFSRQSKSSGQSALERLYDDHLNDAIQAALRGDHDEATRHSGAALTISRELYGRSEDPARHRPALAAALYNHAGNIRRGGHTGEALALLAESGEHYRALADADPAAFDVRSIDVVVRTGLALQACGDKKAAADCFRSAIRQYPDAPATDQIERDLGLARAYFFLGRCLLSIGTPDEALAEIDKGLFTAERVRQRAGIPAVADFSWLATAPRSFQLVAPDWIAAAVCAMELHDLAARWDVAADAANIAVRISGGMAAMGSASYRELYEAILARARMIWERAQDPVHAALERPGTYQEMTIGAGRVLFATPDLDAVFRATGWITPQ